MNIKDILLTVSCSLLLLMIYPPVKSIVMLYFGVFAIESLGNGIIAGFLVTGLFSSVLGACVNRRALLYGASSGFLSIIGIAVVIPVTINYFWAEFMSLVLFSSAWAYFGYNARWHWLSQTEK